MLSATTPRHPERTRRLIAGLAAGWALTPEARRLVGQLVPDGSLEGVHRLARDRVAYTPERGEIVQLPGVTLARGRGDCDDKTLLVGACAEVFGWRWRPMLLGSHLVTGGYHDIAPGEPFAGRQPFHVWPQVRRGGGWVDVETCDPRAQLGEHPADVIRRYYAQL